MTVNLSWPITTGATSWNVYRSQTSGSGYVKCGITTTAQWTDVHNLPTGVTFFYVVTSVNANGESLFSNQFTATPLAVPPVPVISGVIS